MCQAECFGDQHNGCGHYIRVYYSGETKDCEKSNCKLSSNHAHGASNNCGCRNHYDDYRRVISIFQNRCADCARSVPTVQGRT